MEKTKLAITSTNINQGVVFNNLSSHRPHPNPPAMGQARIKMNFMAKLYPAAYPVTKFLCVCPLFGLSFKAMSNGGDYTTPVYPLPNACMLILWKRGPVEF
jgi:hypothetical protein